MHALVSKEGRVVLSCLEESVLAAYCAHSRHCGAMLLLVVCFSNLIQHLESIRESPWPLLSSALHCSECAPDGVAEASSHALVRPRTSLTNH